jgi:hypothetical protein
MKWAIIGAIIAAGIWAYLLWPREEGQNPAAQASTQSSSDSAPVALPPAPRGLADALSAFEASKAAVDEAKAGAIARLTERSAGYRRLLADAASAKSRMEAIVDTGGPRARESKLDAQQAYNTAKIKINMFERDAESGDEGVKSAQAAKERALAAVMEAAKRPLVEPLRSNMIGVLPAFKVVQIVDPKRMRVALEGGTELMLEDVSTFALKEGQRFQLDQPVELEGGNGLDFGKKRVLVGRPYSPK